MFRMILVPVLMIAACDSPTPSVARWNHETVVTGGMAFGVHWAGDRAEAYRTSTHFRPRKSVVMANALAAIQQASGCTVRPGIAQRRSGDRQGRADVPAVTASRGATGATGRRKVRLVGWSKPGCAVSPMTRNPSAAKVAWFSISSIRV